MRGFFDIDEAIRNSGKDIQLSVLGGESLANLDRQMGADEHLQPEGTDSVGHRFGSDDAVDAQAIREWNAEIRFGGAGSKR